MNYKAKLLRGLIHAGIFLRGVSARLIENVVVTSVKHNIDLTEGYTPPASQGALDPDDDDAEPTEPARAAETPEPGFVTNNKVIEPVFEPLPEYRIFEAMFRMRYGRYGKCVINIFNQQHAYTCPELYEALSKIYNDPEAPTEAKQLYGTVISVIIHRKDVTPAKLSDLN